jgi:hypothetical protein
MPWPAVFSDLWSGLRLGVAILGLGLGAAAVKAQDSDGVAVNRRLSDAEFYRLATCGAPPGSACRSNPLRWGKSTLTVSLMRGDDPLPPRFAARLTSALRAAIDEVNGVGAGIRLRYTSRDDADIRVIPTAIEEGTELTDTPGFSGSGIMGVGYMTVWSDSDDQIVEAVILISTGISRSDLASVMLEELTQSLGFLYDVEGAVYEGVSILSQTSNATVSLTGQDARILKLHYPPLP